MSTALVVPEKSTIERAYELAITAPIADGTKEELEAIRAAMNSLLPVEELAMKRLRTRGEELAVALRRSQVEFPMMPMEPLGWRWKNGLPQLALLRVSDGPTFSIAASMGSSWWMQPDLPSELEGLYSDVGKLAQSYCVRPGSSRTYSFTFEGVIPGNVRETINEAHRSCKFQGIYMLCESPAEAWQVKQVKGLTRRQVARERIAAMNIDPLILGYSHGSLWVLDKFDLTTLEQYVLDEFSQKALLPG